MRTSTAGFGAAVLLMLFGLLLLAMRKSDSRTQAPSPSQIVRVVTFNAQFLPGPGRLLNRRPDAAYRAEALAERLQSFDVIALNEVFDREAKSVLLEELGKHVGSQLNVVQSPKDAVSPLGIGSGLLLISRHRIESTHSLTFGNDSPPLGQKGFGDGFAAKGALHARIVLGPAGSVDVFATHLESRDAGIRGEQIAVLADFLAEHSRPECPLLLAGDFNVVGGEPDQRNPASEYCELVRSLQAAYPHARLLDLGALLEETETGTGDADRPDGGPRIDYLFLASPTSARVRLRPRVVLVERFADARVKTLSDHLAVTAELLVLPSGSPDD